MLVRVYAIARSHAGVTTNGVDFSLTYGPIAEATCAHITWQDFNMRTGVSILFLGAQTAVTVACPTVVDSAVKPGVCGFVSQSATRR